MDKIGFYNKVVDDIKLLNECDIIFDDFKDLKNNSKVGDVVILASALSLYHVNSVEFMELMNDLNLDVHILNSNIDNKYMNTFVIHTLLSQINFIKDSAKQIKTLLKYDEEFNKSVKLEKIENQIKIKSKILEKLNEKLRVSDKYDLNTGGRPKVYSEEQLKFASECKLDGYTYTQIDKELKISKSTLIRYMKKNNLLPNNSK